MALCGRVAALLCLGLLAGGAAAACRDVASPGGHRTPRPSIGIACYDDDGCPEGDRCQLFSWIVAGDGVLRQSSNVGGACVHSNVDPAAPLYKCTQNADCTLPGPCANYANGSARCATAARGPVFYCMPSSDVAYMPQAGGGYLPGPTNPWGMHEVLGYLTMAAVLAVLVVVFVFPCLPESTREVLIAHVARATGSSKHE